MRPARPRAAVSSGRPAPRRRTALTALALAVAGLTACAPGGGSAPAPGASEEVSRDVASAGPVTLTVWDQNVDGGIDAAQEELNAAFTELHPNVTIERVSRSFADLKTTLGTALSSPDAPDVVQANQGHADMGVFVQAGALRPLDDYAELYGWSDAFPEQQLALNSFSPDGTQWQGDSLYGVSQIGEIVGVYYNRTLLADAGVEPPTTLAELEAAFEAVADEGVLPLSFGSLEQYPGIHLFGVVHAALAGADEVADLVTGRGGAWTDPAPVAAAETLRRWAEQGHLPPDSAGIAREEARSVFERGDAAFFVDGTWQLQPLAEAMGDEVGFLALAPEAGAEPVTTGGVGLAWALTSAAEEPDVAAAYIDFVTDADSSRVLLEHGNLPAVLPADRTPPAGALEADVLGTWSRITDSGGLVPYLDYTTPTFYDTLTAAVQELLAGRLTPEAFAERLERDAEGFRGER